VTLSPALPQGGGSLLSALLHPRVVAIVGASDDATKTTGRPLRFLRASGYAGTVYPVNPKRETVLGERAWPSIASLPQTPEHVYIVTPTEMAIDAVEECGRRGVRVATVLANGFSEAGEAGFVHKCGKDGKCRPRARLGAPGG